MDLQSAFYIIGIVFMSLMLVLFITLVVAVFVIKAKINAIHQKIDDKLSIVTGAVEKGKAAAAKIKRTVTG